MDLLPSTEQQQIVDACIQFLENELPVDRLHKLEGPLLRRDQLQKIAELGWLGLGLPEEKGGVGYTLKEEVLLFVELGRFLVSPSVLASVLGARVAAQAEDATLAAQIIAGEKTVAIESGGYLFEGQDADLVLRVSESTLSLVAKKALGSTEKIICMDEKVQMEKISAVTASPLAQISGSDDNLYYRGVLLSAALQLGIARATLDRSVAYAKIREQYGKPIGSFQAIKHYCAEMAVKCESVTSLLYHAAIVLDNPQGPYGENARYDAVAAKLLATDAAQHNANTAVQIHGGMGFTQEMDIHLFVKRAHVQDQLFGGKRQQAKALVSLASPVL